MKTKILARANFYFDKMFDFDYEEPKLSPKKNIWCDDNFWCPIDRDIRFCPNCFGNNINPVPMSEIL